MDQPDLSHTTLFCADCVDTARSISVVEKCKTLCRFGAVRYLTSLETDYPHDVIRPLYNLNDYSAFMIKEAYKYVDTPYMLIVQHDGWIVNPETWDPSWVQYGYIGPLYLQERVIDEQSVGSGGFSFRSRALMQAVSEITPPWDGHCSWNGYDGKNYWAYEDGVISKNLRGQLVRRGHVFAPVSVAVKFAFGGNLHQYYPKAFGFHGSYAINRMMGGPGDPIMVRPDQT